MAGDNDKNKKGFSGLSDLASEVTGVDEPIKSEPKAEAKPSAPEQSPRPQREKDTSKAERETQSSPPPIETVSSGNNAGSSGGKWILGIIGVVFVIWLINNEGQSNRKSSYTPPSSTQSYGYPKSSPAPAVRTPISSQNGGLKYIKPSVGTNNVLSVPQIRWCVREGIRIEAMRGVIDNNSKVARFNRIVDDYNSRCGSYRYRQGSRSRAERDVEPYRSQIVAEAIRQARQFDSSQSVHKKPSAKYTREAQQLLTELGYNPGPIDGDYGRRTAAAVKAFQRDAGITQDGWIDQDLLSVLRQVANRRSNLPPSIDVQAKLPETRKSSGPPANSWVQGENWYCNSGFKKVGEKCVSINPPANSWVQGANWYCNSGFKKVGKQCVSINPPANSWVQGENWYCNSGFKKVGDKCVSIFGQ